MKLEEADSKLNNHPPVQFLLHGYRVEDGIYRMDAVGCVDRNDAARESKKFVKYFLYRLEIDKNQNL
jgi:hypothetical protein